MRALLGYLDFSFFVFFLLFITFNISCYYLLACRVSVEILTDCLMGIPWCNFCCFPLAVLNTFFFIFIFFLV